MRRMIVRGRTVVPGMEYAVERRAPTALVLAGIGAALFAVIGMAVVFGSGVVDFGGRPTRAHFCAAYDAFTEAGSTAEAKRLVADMAPAEDMTGLQVEGFRVVADFVAASPEGGDRLPRLSTESLHPDDRDSVTAFFGYVETHCTG
jgi:hypothetical protein